MGMFLLCLSSTYTGSRPFVLSVHPGRQEPGMHKELGEVS